MNFNELVDKISADGDRGMEIDSSAHNSTSAKEILANFAENKHLSLSVYSMILTVTLISPYNSKCIICRKKFFRRYNIFLFPL